MSNILFKDEREKAQNRGYVGGGVGAQGGDGGGINVGMPGVLPDGTIQRLRGLTYPATVLATPTQLLPPDFDRKFLFIQNNDALGIVWVSFGAPAVLGVGMRLSAGGGGILLDNNVPTAEVNVIGTIAINPNLTIIVG